MSEQRSRPSGYTIVEAMIFLAVTSGLFISAATLISGQQARTEFTQSVRDVEARLRDVANDVSTGYYASTNTFTCSSNTAPGVPPTITASASGNQGGNTGCIFLGRAIHLAPDGTNGEGLLVYTVVGKQRIIPPTETVVREVQDLDEAEPQVVDIPSSFETGRFSGGVRVERIRNVSTGALLSGVAFFSSLGLYDDGALQSGSGQVNIYPIGGDVNNSTASTTTAIEAFGNTTVSNPPGGVEICIESNNERSSVLMTLGGSNRQLTTNTVFQDAPC